MSRIAKQPIAIPSGTTVKIDGADISVKGPKGEISRVFDQGVVSIKEENGAILVAAKNEEIFSKALSGTYASHLKNMIAGVNTPYTRKLILEGVGFKSDVKGKPARTTDAVQSGGDLNLALGFSHPVVVPIPEGISVKAEKNLITIEGIDKEKVGQFAASVRALKKPEPYKGKGFRYEDEIIRRKQGKKTA